MKLQPPERRASCFIPRASARSRRETKVYMYVRARSHIQPPRWLPLTRARAYRRLAFGGFPGGKLIGNCRSSLPGARLDRAPPYPSRLYVYIFAVPLSLALSLTLSLQNKETSVIKFFYRLKLMFLRTVCARTLTRSL